MRANSSARLAAALFLGVAAATPFELTECLVANADRLAAFASCGHAGSIEYCIANRLPADAQPGTVDVLAQCFIDAGCQPEEARIEADWTIKRCEPRADLGELRRRADTSTKTTAKTTEKTTETTASTTETTTTAASTAASTASTDSTASKTLATKDVASTYTGTSTSSSLVCQTTTTITTKTCPTQSTGTASGKELSCFSTQQSFATCAAGLMCTIDDEGKTNCMKKRGADAAGIVIGIVFGTGILIAVSTLCFFCCRERRQDARLTKTAEAAAIARQAVIDSKKAKAATAAASAPSIAVSDSQPLMSQQAPQLAGYDEQAYAPQYHSSVSNHDLRSSETSGDIAGPNPFADQQGLR